jgi:hypothetical protein
MKIVKSLFVISIVSLLLSTITVNAALRWVEGETFNYKGQTFTKEVERNGNFYNGLKLHTKTTSETMIVKLKGEKKGWLFYGTVGDRVVGIYGEGNLNNKEEYCYYKATGNNKVRLTWKQETSGTLTATLLY